MLCLKKFRLSAGLPNNVSFDYSSDLFLRLFSYIVSTSNTEAFVTKFHIASQLS
jgi:hypothetical protein